MILLEVQKAGDKECGRQIKRLREEDDERKRELEQCSRNYRT